MSIKISGVTELRKEIRKLGRGFPEIVRQSLEEVADDFINVVTPKVPKDTGRLREGATKKVTRKGNSGRLNFEISYSAINPANGYDYAYIQHENIYFHHTVGEHHYLTKAYDEWGGMFVVYFEARLKEKLK